MSCVGWRRAHAPTAIVQAATDSRNSQKPTALRSAIGPPQRRGRRRRAESRPTASRRHGIESRETRSHHTSCSLVHSNLCNVVAKVEMQW